jgi:hypothetical protein
VYRFGGWSGLVARHEERVHTPDYGRYKEDFSVLLAVGGAAISNIIIGLLSKNIVGTMLTETYAVKHIESQTEYSKTNSIIHLRPIMRYKKD